MADRFWKSVPAVFRKPALDELYKRLRDLDYTQMDETLAVMLNVIMQHEAQGECRESATEAVLMVGYTSDRLSNQEQTRVARGKEKKRTPTEPVRKRSRPESRTEVDEAPRSSGRFDLDCVAQVRMNEG